MNANIIAILLSLAPTAPTDRAPPFEIADIDVEIGKESTHVLAFDADGEVSAEFVVWVDSSEALRLDVTFADGLYLHTIVDGDNATTESSDHAEVAARVGAIEEWLAESPQPRASWLVCGAKMVMAGGTCALAPPFLCPPAVAVAACECLQLLSQLTNDNAECW